MKNKWLIHMLLFVIFIFPLMSIAQTTGKIAGNVSDAETEEPLAGAQVIIEGKWVDGVEVEMEVKMGATADLDGDFFIINIPPESYTISIQMMGYETMKLMDVRVSVNRTYAIKAELNPSILEGEVITVTAPAVEMKKDQTSSIRNISSEDIEILPVENISQVVSMQPGVVVGHFRGGRLSEVSYLLDGLQIDESFGQTGHTVNVNTEVVEEIEVITGTFNAEYGKAMSGIVNVITKEGGEIFAGYGYFNTGNYLTSHNDIFLGLDNSDFTRRKDYRTALFQPFKLCNKRAL
jgi:hypothetical protein